MASPIKIWLSFVTKFFYFMEIFFSWATRCVTYLSSCENCLFDYWSFISKLNFLLMRKVLHLRFFYFFANYTQFFPLSTLVISWFNFCIIEFYLVLKNTFFIHSNFLVSSRVQVLRYSSFKITIPFGLFLSAGQYLEYFRFLKYTDIWSGFAILILELRRVSDVHCILGADFDCELENFELTGPGLHGDIFVGWIFLIPKMLIRFKIPNVLMKRRIYWPYTHLFAFVWFVLSHQECWSLIAWR